MVQRLARFHALWTSRLLHRYRTWVIAAVETVLILGALLLAWLLRFEFSLPDAHLLAAAAPLLVAIRLVVNDRFNLLHGWWRYAGVSDALCIVKAVALGSVIFVVVVRYLLGITLFPRSVYILEAILTAGLLAGARLLTRAYADAARRDVGAQKKLIVIGAGFAAEMLLRELRRPGNGYAALCCLDDDASKKGVSLQGVRVVGSVDELPQVLRQYPADEVLIAVPSASARQMRRFVDICKQAGVPFKTVPSLRELIAGELSLNQIRDVDLNDLLGRDPVRLDLESVRRHLRDRVVMVTGAAGSIGSELCRQILQYKPARLLCLDRSETAMFYLHADLGTRPFAERVTYSVSDITDLRSVSKLLQENPADVLFHAAAYKHVPIMEINSREAVKNNVLALPALLDAAEAAGCRKFVMISTDKAVNPSSVMGATKRIGEVVCASRPGGAMECVSVRFGNVVGSNGSVIPVLQEAIRHNQPLTITHPEMRRFFMTISEAVSLVLQAFTVGRHGDILVLDMGEPVSVLEIARTLIRMAGKSDDQVEIRFTGVRQGEKLSEELFYPYEQIASTEYAKIKRTRGSAMEWQWLLRQLGELRHVLYVDGPAPIAGKLAEIVPEYRHAISITHGNGNGRARAATAGSHNGA